MDKRGTQRWQNNQYKYKQEATVILLMARDIIASIYAETTWQPRAASKTRARKQEKRHLSLETEQSTPLLTQWIDHQSGQEEAHRRSNSNLDHTICNVEDKTIILISRLIDR